MINYDEELKKLRFGFRPEEIVDYQTLVSLVGSLSLDHEAYEANKEELFHTVQILALVYGIEDHINEIDYRFNPDNININELDLWKYLLVAIFNDLEKNSSFTLSEDTLNKVYLVLKAFGSDVGVDIEKAKDDTPVVETMSNAFTYNVDSVLSTFNWDYLREYLISSKALEYKCACCGMNEWQGKPLKLMLSHKNDTNSQELDNLQFLCPNCYSQIGK